MNKIFSLSLLIGLIVGSCTDPNTIGLEVYPMSDNIIISDTSSFSWQNAHTESEDSLRTDEALNLILGQISQDPIFGENKARIYTQILLTENNTDLGNNPIVDSVILSYTYSGYSGDPDNMNDLEVSQIDKDIYKDSIYYNNSFDIEQDDMENIVYNNNFTLSDNLENPFLRVKLKNEFGQYILSQGSDLIKDNETFLQWFKGISILALSTNTMLYLSPNGSNSYLKIYYRNDESDSTLSLDFELGGDAARINLFNPKEDIVIINDESKIYIQSMAGYKAKITIQNKDLIKNLLEGKVINKVTMRFDVELGSQSDEYLAHNKLFLVRVDEEGNNIFLSDYNPSEETYFGGGLENEKYEFKITSYFTQLLYDNSYTNDLYLLPAGAAVNANRTILEKDITLTIHYSKL